MVGRFAQTEDAVGGWDLHNEMGSSAAGQVRTVLVRDLLKRSCQAVCRKERIAPNKSRCE